MVAVRTLQRKYKPCFESPQNSVLRLHKAQYRNHVSLNFLYSACCIALYVVQSTLCSTARGHKTYMCAIKTPELGIFWTVKQTNRETCPEIFRIVFCC